MTDLALDGWRVFVTRSPHQSSDLSTRLKNAGADVIEAPVIRIESSDDWSQFEQAVRCLDRTEWLIFTSRNAVHFFLQRLGKVGLKVQPGTRVAAVGRSTVACLKDHSVAVEFHPAKFDSEALCSGLVSRYDFRGARVLFPCGNLAGPVVEQSLEYAGATVTRVVVYRTVQSDHLPAEVLAALQDGQRNVMTFTSSSSVSAFLGALESSGQRRLISNCIVACLGPATARTARESGLHVSLVADEATIPSFLDSIARTLSSSN